MGDQYSHSPSARTRLDDLPPAPQRGISVAGHNAGGVAVRAAVGISMPPRRCRESGDGPKDIATWGGTAARLPEGLIALDVDPRHGGDRFLAGLQA